MPSLFSTMATVASISVAMAAPTPQIVGRSTFQVKQVEGPKVFKAGPLAMMRTYEKYAKVGAKAPADVVSAAAAASNQQGSVAANPEQYDSAYLCPVTVGSNTLTLDFDTGSSDLWVFSTVTPADEQGSHNLYNPDNSGTLLSGESWDISYGDGSGAAGTVYADTVTVGSVSATSQAVEAATSASSTFVSGASDGLLGLAFSSINTVTPQQQTTFFDTVKSTLSQQLFTADLQAGQPGSYDFGFIDSSKYTGDITYVAVDNSQGFWGFNAGGYGVGSTSGSIGSSIADTGTTLMYLPDDAVTGYYGNVPSASYDSNQGGYTFPCGTSLPDFMVEIGGATFTVPGSYLNYAPTDNSGQTCFGGMQSNSGIGMTIFGDIFLKSVFVVFDETSGSPQLGFAEQ